MKLRLKFLKLGLLGMTLLQTGCATNSCVQAKYLHPLSKEILELKAGQTYTAETAQKWHSDARYQKLELELLDAVSVAKQAQHR
jgi:hypothetical protein